MHNACATEGFILKDWPRPNLQELPGLYALLDDYVERIETIFGELPEILFNKDTQTINFGDMSENDFTKLISQDPIVMVIAFTRVCGLSIREFNRVFELKNVYSLRYSDWQGGKDQDIFVNSIRSLLPKFMHLETFLYTFYKMWEEHQKRHYRGKFEEDVRAFFQSHGYECEKITQPTEVNGAIPPSNPQVVMQIRTGVRRDLVKRSKEFSAEKEESIKYFPQSKFLVIYKISKHELSFREEIRDTIEKHVSTPYDAVVFQDELENVLMQFMEWNISRVDTKK